MVKTTWYIYLYIDIYVHDSYGKLVGKYTDHPTNPVGQIPFFSPKIAACRGPRVSNKWCTTLGHDQHLWPKISGVRCVCVCVSLLFSWQQQTTKDSLWRIDFFWWISSMSQCTTVDGSEILHHLGYLKNAVNNGTNYLSINWRCAGIQSNQQ